jgi:hypothetical protein
MRNRGKKNELSEYPEGEEFNEEELKNGEPISPENIRVA